VARKGEPFRRFEVHIVRIERREEMQKCRGNAVRGGASSSG
jgi:hypothetical protein